MPIVLGPGSHERAPGQSVNSDTLANLSSPPKVLPRHRDVVCVVHFLRCGFKLVGSPHRTSKSVPTLEKFGSLPFPSPKVVTPRNANSSQARLTRAPGQSVNSDTLAHLSSPPKVLPHHHHQCQLGYMRSIP